MCYLLFINYKILIFTGNGHWLNERLLVLSLVLLDLEDIAITNHPGSCCSVLIRRYQEPATDAGEYFILG